jgi:hypothetical protein
MKPTITVKVLLVERFEAPKEWILEVPREMRPEHIAGLVFELSNCPPNFLDESKRAILEKYPRTPAAVALCWRHHHHRRTGMPHRHIATVERTGFKYH